MPPKVSPDKALKRNIAREAGAKVFDVLAVASARRLSPADSAHRADLVLRARSKVKCNKIRTILEVYGGEVIEPYRVPLLCYNKKELR